MKNKYIKYFILSRLLFYTSSIFSMMPCYKNTVRQVQEIQGVSKYSLILKCSEQDPIAVYAPATYQESLNPSYIRIFMPDTTLAENVAPIEGVMQNINSGLEILLFGKLVLKTASNGVLSLVIELT